MGGRKFWGWGLEEHVVPSKTIAFAEASLGALLGVTPPRRDPPEVDRVALARPRITIDGPLAALAASDPRTRLSHALGKSWRDVARAVRGNVPHAPDAVAFPETEADVARLLELAHERDFAVVPYGGGSSVSGGVEAEGCEGFAGTISLDMSRLNRVVEIDSVSRAARIEAGVLGPELERQLKPSGLTLRHFPQSFEFSTLGGWIATRAGGHFATLATHIDDLVESVRVVTPCGIVATRRLPGSGAGPAPDRWFIGSEGALGVITEAWMRLVPRPTFRASATVRFASFAAGLEALRSLSQSGLYPTNARLLDAAEAMISGAGAGDAALLLLAFESADHPLGPWIERAVACARAAGGLVTDDEVKTSTVTDAARNETADGYKAAFFEAPYLRDELVLRDVFVETYETATTWDRLGALENAVRRAASEVVAGPHLLATRITHAYPDGCAPYFTLIARAHPSDVDGQWRSIKEAITSAIIDAGGTSTHHHAVGRDVMPFYERERDALFGEVLAASKRALDPKGIMNPGVLVPARSG